MYSSLAVISLQKLRFFDEIGGVCYPCRFYSQVNICQEAVDSNLSWIYFLSFADPAIKADDVCFKYANTQGTQFGNCGISSTGQPIKCPVE